MKRRIVCLMEEIMEIKDGIRSLEIQGARNVAMAGLKCLKIAALNAQAENPEALLREMEAVARSVSLIRVTEPYLRNVLASVLAAMRKETGVDVNELRTFAAERCDDLFKVMKSNIPKICKHGASVIKDGSTIFTHCHSSSVTSLIMAESKKKDIHVLCTETRPRWQGRITADELAASDIDTTMFVDSAARMYMKEAELVLIGADAVGGGHLYNKIGSYMVMHFANLYGIPAYSVCETQKFDPLVGIGYVQPVEQRPASEVIEGTVPFKVRNPAFETVPVDMFTGIITEEGIMRPDEVDRVIHRYDHLVPDLKKLVEWDEWEE